MQDILAILIVAVAAIYLARRLWLRLVLGRRGTCGLCPGCSPSESVKQRALVTLDQLQSSATSLSQTEDSPQRHRDHGEEMQSTIKQE